jgi:hypothetical protein
MGLGLDTLKRELNDDGPAAVPANPEDEFDAALLVRKQNGVADTAATLKSEAATMDFMSGAAEDVLNDGSDLKRYDFFLCLD